jgi:hypothetical protein
MTDEEGIINRFPLFTKVGDDLVLIGDLELSGSGVIVGVVVTHSTASPIGVRISTESQKETKPEVQYCSLTETPDRNSFYLWCMDHKKFASHRGPHGNVCIEFAQINGCDCCPENYKKD